MTKKLIIATAHGMTIEASVGLNHAMNTPTGKEASVVAIMLVDSPQSELIAAPKLVFTFVCKKIFPGNKES